jgi:LacI family transcriptional regulator
MAKRTGTQKINVRMIAEKAGCAASTVSRVLSGNYGNVHVSQKLKDRITAIRDELGYEPNIHASRLFGKKAGVIGLATPEFDAGSRDDNLSYFIGAVYKALSDAGCRLLLLMLNKQFVADKAYLSLARRNEVDGLIIWGNYGSSTWLNELKKAELPFILGVNRSGKHPCVYCDDTAGMAAMVSHCRERGAQRFVYVGSGEGDCAKRRYKGFVKAIGKDPYLIIEGEYVPATGEKAAKALIHDLPDAIVCGNDRIAFGLIMSLTQAGVRVPEDVIVTGADNTELAQFVRPALTTYDQLSADCGSQCAQLLLDHIHFQKPLQTHILQPVIHIRESA